MREWDIVTALDVCVDLIMTGDTTPRFGQVEQLVDDYAVEMGGSCAIFASQCAKLGLRTLGLGVCGADAFGAAFAGALKDCGVDVSALRVDPACKTGLGLALMRGDDRAILTYTGTIDALTEADLPDALLARCRHLHIGSYYLMDKLRPCWPDIARRAKALGLSVSLDANWDPAGTFAGLNELLPYVDVLLPNAQELRAMGDLAALRERVPILAVKDGAEGASVYARDGREYHARAFPMPLVDAIGAGDSFDGGFLSAWLRGRDLLTCLKFGCACGGLSVRARGGTAAQGRLPDVEALASAR